MTEIQDDAGGEARDVKRRQWHRMPGWKKGWLAASVACMIAGAVMTIATRLRPEPRSAVARSSVERSGEMGGERVAVKSGGTSVAPAGSRGFVDGRNAPRSSEGAGNETVARSGGEAEGPGATEDSPGPTSMIGRFSPALFKLGFSFFAGFCVAYALRAFLKLAVLVMGVVFLGAFALQYFGMADIPWHLIGGRYDSVAQWVTSQFASFERFVTGQLPSAASAGLGLLVGFKR